MIKGVVPALDQLPGVRAFSTQRHGGVSVTPYGSLNLGMHVGDLPASVLENRQRLKTFLQLPNDPCWLTQVHGHAVAAITQGSCSDMPEADAAYTRTKGTVLAIQTADCLPILLASADGREIAAIHSGWRSLAGGIIAETLAHFESDPNLIQAWLGPAIGPQHFEVGDDVHAAMLALDAENHDAFTTYGEKYLADLARIATRELNNRGVVEVESVAQCTFADKKNYFSFRRDGQTGRMVSLIWLE